MARTTLARRTTRRPVARTTTARSTTSMVTGGGGGTSPLMYLLPTLLVGGLVYLLWPKTASAATPPQPQPQPPQPGPGPGPGPGPAPQPPRPPATVVPDVPVPAYPAGTRVWTATSSQSGNVRGAPDVRSRIVQAYGVGQQVVIPNINDLRNIGSDQAPQGWVPAQMNGRSGWVAINKFVNPVEVTPSTGYYAASPYTPWYR